MIHAWTRAHGVDEIIAGAAALRIPVAAVGTGETVADFDHFVARGAAFVPHPGAHYRQPRARTDSPPPPCRRCHPGPAPRRAPRRGIPQPGGPRLRIDQKAPAAPSGATVRRPGDAFPRRPARRRLHRLLGRPLRHPVPRRHGRRRGQGRVDPTSGRHALPEHARPPSSDGWWEWSALYQTVNLGKRGITLDLDARGRGW
ncbi:MAG: hypothetical protein U0802_16110 [Candidatus Binatia bacterium]